MVYRVYENKTEEKILFHIPTVIGGGNRERKHYVVYPNQSVEIELIENPNGLNSWEKAKYFGLTLKKGSVQNVSKAELPPEALAGILIPIAETKKRKTKKKR